MPSAVSFRYARALADLVAGPEQTDAVRHELGAFEQALAASSDLRVALESPAVPAGRKQAVVTQLAAMLPLSQLVRRFVLVLIDHRRVPLLSEIREAFEAVMDERLGVVRVDVLSARELDPAERETVMAHLVRLTGKQARARFAIRPELIGGIMARIGSTVYDGSLKGQLEALRRRLAGVQG